MAEPTLLMSPTTSLAKPLARRTTQCPYCDHVSPAESKFCNDCGAALHLMPCPHCGAVNDITVSTACYRCHGELRESVPAALPAPATTAPASPKSSPAKVAPYIIAEPPARQRPHALIVGIILLAFGAASYYAYRQRSALDVRERTGTEVKDRSTPADTNANAGTIIKAPADAALSPAPTPFAAPVELKTARPDPAPSLDTAGSPAAAAIVAPDIARARIDASKGLEKQPPYIGPCTDAVAALGLCTPEPTPRRE